MYHQALSTMVSQAALLNLSVLDWVAKVKIYQKIPDFILQNP